MGFISDNVKTKGSIADSFFPGADRSRSVYRERFHHVSKEDGDLNKPTSTGGSFGRSAISGGNAFKRLLQAMRSDAPGGWSDDRYEQSRHYNGIQYLAINRTNEQLAQSEFQVFRKDEMHPDGKRPVRKGDRGYELVELLEKPNPDDSFGDLLSMWNLQMDMTGMALTWMVPNELGTPMELYPIPTAIAVPQPVINPDYPHGYYRIQPVYPYGPFSSTPTPNSAVGAPIPAEWMIRMKYPHPFLRYDGYSPFTAMRLHIDEIESMDRSRWYSMKKSLNPSAVLNFDEMEGAEPLPDEEIDRIRAEWEADFQGPENHGRLIVSPPGGRLDLFGMNPKDMDYQSGWEQLVSFVMAGYGISKTAAGMIETSSYSTLFATLKQFHLLTINPKLRRISNKLTRYLAPHFGDDLIIEIRCERIDDQDQRNAKISIAMSALAITKNEVRKELDMPLTKEEWGVEIAGIPTPPPMVPGMMPGQEGQVLGQQQEIPPEVIQLLVEQGIDPNQVPPEVMQQLIQEIQGGNIGMEKVGGNKNPQENERPQPRNMSAGSQGPRKSIENFFKKNLNGKVHSNGRVK